MSTIAPEIKQQWTLIAPYLTISNDQEYEQAIARLNSLIDEVGTNEAHPLYSLLDTLGILIEAYESENYEIPDCTGVEMLLYLMEEHSLTQSDLPEIGSQEVLSEIINGKRELNIRQVKTLAQRFHISSSVFL
ncbi:MAG: type II toxin-antitoxin system HigA family antitoxin [Xenococcus sp. (in: cyanobacteria)]